MALKYKTICVDFDGVLAYTNDEVYPEVLEVNTTAIQWLKLYQSKGGRIILFTCRADWDLEVALNKLIENKFVVDAINQNTQENIDKWRKKHPHSSLSVKPFCDMYIDDSTYPNNITGIDWALLGRELLKEV